MWIGDIHDIDSVVPGKILKVHVYIFALLHAFGQFKLHYNMHTRKV